MRLILLTNLYPPYIIGGNEILARDVVQRLRARGHEVLVVTGRGQDLVSDQGLLGLFDLCLDRKNEMFLFARPQGPREAFRNYLFSWKNYAVTRNIIRSFKPHLVVAWNLNMLSVSPLIAARSTPTVIHVCDNVPLYMLKDLRMVLHPKPLWKRFLLRLAQAALQPMLYRLANPQVMVAVSRFMRDTYIKARFPERIFRVAYLGIPIELFSPAPKMGTGRIMKFLYVGRLDEWKGPQVAIQALAHLVHHFGYAKVHLDICGAGSPEFESYLKRIVENQKTNNHVSFLGFVARMELANLYRNHDALLLPSIWEEPFAAAPLEAMACGLPVIATSTGGTPEAVSHEETGLLVPPNDPIAMAEAMRRLTEDKEFRFRLGNAARAKIGDHFSLQAYVERLEAIYKEAIRDARER